MTFPYTIEIIFEDDEVLVLNKPSGLVVHGNGKTRESTLADWLLNKYPDIKAVGEPWTDPSGQVIPRPGIVHRLDRETSGVMIVAKTQESFRHLKKQFQERAVKKIYNAFVYGTLKDSEGIIDRPIGKSNKDFRMWSAQRGARGKLRDALTRYSVIKEGAEVSYLEIKPETGRTHQIRVHMKAIHHPVVCDSLYAPKHKCLLGFERLALHARTLSFTTQGGKEEVFEAPLTRDFERAIEFSD